MGSNWDWQVFLQDPGGEYPTYWQWMLSAWGWTVSVALLALLIALIVGSLIGIIRTLPDAPWAVRFGNAWVELFRNIPLLVQIFLWYHVIPALVPAMKGVPSFLLVVFALGFFTSARIAEQVRSGIQALPKGQRYAGMAVGFTTFQYYRYVILPMAYRIIIPPLTSETMNLIKNSSIALTIGLAELTFRSREIGEYTFRFFEAFTAATVIYLVLAMTANRVMAWVERRTSVPGFIAGGK